MSALPPRAGHAQRAIAEEKFLLFCLTGLPRDREACGSACFVLPGTATRPWRIHDLPPGLPCARNQCVPDRPSSGKRGRTVRNAPSKPTSFSSDLLTSPEGYYHCPRQAGVLLGPRAAPKTRLIQACRVSHSGCVGCGRRRNGSGYGSILLSEAGLVSDGQTGLLIFKAQSIQSCLHYLRAASIAAIDCWQPLQAGSQAIHTTRVATVLGEGLVTRSV
jgi:hypothetical protein